MSNRLATSASSEPSEASEPRPWRNEAGCPTRRFAASQSAPLRSAPGIIGTWSLLEAKSHMLLCSFNWTLFQNMHLWSSLLQKSYAKRKILQIHANSKNIGRNTSCAKPNFVIKMWSHSIRTNGYKWNLFRTYFGQNESLRPLQLLSQSTQLLVEALNLSCGCGSQNSSDLLGLSWMWNNG